MDKVPALRIVWMMFEGFQFPKTIITWMDAHSGAASWAQAVISGIAIGAVYYAATMPIRAEAKRAEKERAERAYGLRRLLGPEIMTLRGQIEHFIRYGSAADNPIVISTTIMDRADQMYLLGETGHTLLQAFGTLNGIAAQMRRYHQACDAKKMPLEEREKFGASLWEECASAYKLCLESIDKVIDNLMLT